MNAHAPSKAAKNLRKLSEVREMMRVLDAQMNADTWRLQNKPNPIVNWAKYADELMRIANVIKRGERG